MKPEDRSRRVTGQAHPVDVFVGTRSKQRRTEVGMSQQVLGQSVNLTFQQVQKYERGANRVGSSRLFEIANALDVPIAYFFEGMPQQVSGNHEKTTDAHEEALESYAEGSVLSRSETLRLVTHYYRLKSEAQRRAIYILIKDLG